MGITKFNISDVARGTTILWMNLISLILNRLKQSVIMARYRVEISQIMTKLEQIIFCQSVILD